MRHDFDRLKDIISAILLKLTEKLLCWKKRRFDGHIHIYAPYSENTVYWDENLVIFLLILSSFTLLLSYIRMIFWTTCHNRYKINEKEQNGWKNALNEQKNEIIDFRVLSFEEERAPPPPLPLGCSPGLRSGVRSLRTGVSVMNPDIMS